MIELQAHDWVARAPLPEIVTYLREVLTPRLTALLGGVRETRATREWAEGLREPSAATQARLRAAAQVAKIVETTFDAPTVQSWIQSMDPMLETSRRCGCCATPKTRTTCGAYCSPHGMPERFALTLDNLTLLPKAFLGERIVHLGARRMAEVCQALAVATSCA